MDPRYQVKQWLSRIQEKRGLFDVFATGDSRFVLFRCVAGTDKNGHGGWNTGLEFPVARKDLRKDVAQAIRHGWSIL